jgi:NADPH2:quinone reductase
MRAIQMHQTGGPEVLTEVELPTPEPGPGELRVRAEAIGVGRPDVLVRQGTYRWMPPLPAIPGSEMVGVVDALGPGATHPPVGARVLVSARELTVRGGCYAQYICVPATAVFVLPDSIAPVDAISLPNFQLANAMFKCNGDLPARTVLVTGAAGGVACALTQIARSRGMRVLGTASTPQKVSYALANGVNNIVSRDPAELATEVLGLTHGRGVDLAFDHLGGDTLPACVRALAPLGMAVSYNVVTGAPTADMFQTLRALLGRSLAVRVFSMHTFDEFPDLRRALMQTAIDQMASGAVKAPPAQVLALSDIRKAHAALDAGASMGKIVIQP